MGGPFDRILDRSIVFSFDRSGYTRHQRHFAPGDLQLSLAGQVALVTGASSGIGYATAQGLGRLGATVHLLSRDPARAEGALNRLRQELPEVQWASTILDVSSLAAVRRYVEASTEPIDILVHNAGILPDQRSTTAEGLESTWATNLVGPFLLTELLRPRLRPGARVIQVASGGMYTRRLSLEDRNFERRPFDGVLAYANTKRAMVVLNELWAERDPQRSYAAMHPGWADTPSVRSALPRFYRVTKSILRTPAEGADTVVWLAAEARGPSGRFWFDRSEAPTHLIPGTVEAPEVRSALWSALMADSAR
jgi:dehydrogenase/reductase SDR family protein 12